MNQDDQDHCRAKISDHGFRARSADSLEVAQFHEEMVKLYELQLGTLTKHSRTN